MLARALLLFVLIVVIYASNAFVNPIPRRKVDPDFKPVYGTSFSFEQAGWYGLNPRESYIKLLDEFNFQWVRLPFFWNHPSTGHSTLRDEPSGSDSKSSGQKDLDGPGNLDDLKFAIEEAKKRNVGVIVALGAKTPYFPEYHWPKEIEKQVKFGQRITTDHPVAKDILDIDKKVVKELAIYDNIIYWQVENEPLIGNINKWKIDPSLLALEVGVVRKADPLKRPVILNHAATGFYDTSWQNLLPILKPGDVFAVNAFFKTKGKDLITAKIFGREIHVLWPDHLVWPVHSWFFLSPNYQEIKNNVESKGLKFWILEMQAEPYIKKLDEASDPLLSFTPFDIAAADEFLRSYRIESIGLWGVHFWQFREKQQDNLWIETVKKIVNN